MVSNKKHPPKIILKKGLNLSTVEITQIEEAVLREFKQTFTAHNHSADTLFFLLKDNDEVLAFGALSEVAPVMFNDETFSFLGVLNVISNVKGKGYGKQVVSSMRKYMIAHDRTGLGFCMPMNQGFYEKCGFQITTTSTPQFVYRKSGNMITNQDGQFIFYQDSSDNFMQKVLANPNAEVSIPTQNLW